jgi:DNA-directed RNA polymerase subunit beta'
MLLDISRRNLDRVLYFAQYIVTYVDEDARTKALKRLEDEISVSEREQAAEINAKIAGIKTKRDHTTSEINQKRTNLEQNYDEVIAEKLDPVIKEGQKLEKVLQDQMGEAAKKTIVFELTGEKILDAGDKVATKHISQVQKIVKTKLEALENELKDQRAKNSKILRWMLGASRLMPRCRWNPSAPG